MDFFDEIVNNLRSGPQNTPTTAQPVASPDMMDQHVAIMRAEALAAALEKKKKKAPMPGDIGGMLPEASIGEVQAVPGYSSGESLLNGLLQGYYPQIFGGLAAKPFIQTNEKERAAASADYAKRMEEKTAAKKEFAVQNPGMALSTELGGSVASALPMMAAGQEYMAAPMGQMLRGLAPKVGGAIADFLGGSSTGAMTVPSMAARSGVEGVANAGISSGLSERPLNEQLTTGGVIGMGAGPVLRIAGDKLSSKINSTSAESAQALIDQGIPVRAGQIPGASPVTSTLDKIFSRGKNAEQNELFSEALTGHANTSATPATRTIAKDIDQKWVAKNDARVGKVMNDIQSVYSIPALDNDMLTGLAKVRADATANMSVDNAKKVGQLVDKIEENALNPINGKIYQNITRKEGVLDNFGKDKDIQSAVHQVRDVLDDAWGRSLPVDKKASWDAARRDYKITRVIDDSMGASGAAEGAYNPKKLLAAVEKRFGNVENAGELGELARGGQFLKAPGEGIMSGHSPYKLPLQVGMGVAGGAAVSEGVKRASHYAPEFFAQMAHDPATYVGPAIAAGGALGGGSIMNWLLNRPAATQHLLDVTMGRKSPVLRGVNPVLPFAVEGYNRQ